MTVWGAGIPPYMGSPSKPAVISPSTKADVNISYTDLLNVPSKPLR
jgi:hypothetical protein